MQAERGRGPAPAVRYRTSDAVDVVVVGAGAAGGVVARELSRGGFRVVVLEQGPYLTESDFTHDELDATARHLLTNDHRVQPNTVRASASEPAARRPAALYGRAVGGGTLHFTGNYWRFHELDFVERSRTGGIAGTGLDDWPITYAELEPYYTRVEWEVGVSGLAGASPFDPPRSRPYPLPPLPPQSVGALLERGARRLGWHPFPAPLAILSQPYRGRAACVHCGFCEAYGCEMGAKSSTLVSMIRDAERTGRCEVRPLSYARKVETDRRGRVTGVKYFDAARREQFQRARAVVLSCNGVETPRLLLMSRSARFPDGLANSSGVVGTHLMFNGGVIVGGLFEREVNGYRGVVCTRVVHDFYELDSALGLHGGGGIDVRHDLQPIAFAQSGLPPDAPTWGADYARLLRQGYTRTAYAFGHSTSLPLPTNTVTLDPTVTDAWGLPAPRVTFAEHPNDLAVYRFFSDRGAELLDAAGATRHWAYPTDTTWLPAVHLLGTCRMGNDPRRSVVDRTHRAHDVPNLFVVDGSSFVTGGRGQPTMTIQALAFRAAEGIGRAARRGEI